MIAAARSRQRRRSETNIKDSDAVMLLSPEARRAINVRNAQHSTGPKTAAGRARASLNNLQHGMRSQTLCLPNESMEEFQALLDDWQNRFLPDSPDIQALVDRAVLATVHQRRSTRYLTATLSDQVR